MRVLTVHFGAASPVMRSTLKIKLVPKTIADQHDHFEAVGFVDLAFVCDDYLPRIALRSYRNRYIGGPTADVLHLDPYTGLELSGRLGCLLHSPWSWFSWLRAPRAQARKRFQHIGAVNKIPVRGMGFTSAGRAKHQHRSHSHPEIFSPWADFVSKGDQIKGATSAQ